MRKLAVFVALALAWVPSCRSQQPPVSQYAEPAAIYADRVDDSYSIYSQLLVSGPIEWRDAKRKQWLLEDVTTATPLSTACRPSSGLGPDMTPYNAVIAPEDRKSEWLEVLADYDAHCHDVFLLQSDKFRVDLPIHLLNAAQKKQFQEASMTRNGAGDMPEDFKNAAGLHCFSAVFFNQHHTLALLEQGMWCGGLCGNWTWVVLEKKEGRWNVLPWVNTFTVS
jgi:hypothetical protein